MKVEKMYKVTSGKKETYYTEEEYAKYLEKKRRQKITAGIYLAAMIGDLVCDLYLTAKERKEKAKKVEETKEE